VSGAVLTAREARLLAAMEELIEAADSMRATFGCIRSDTPEDSDTFTHEEWAEDFLKERADAARALVAQCNPEPIPVGEAQDSDFGAFMDEVRK